MIRHRYEKEPFYEGICTCGQGRAEDIHNLMTWRKAESGNWVSDLTDGVVYRCRRDGGKWWPECAAIGEDWFWTALANGLTLAEAKVACEEQREQVSC